MTDRTRDFQRYFEVLQRACSPEELEALRQLYGTPKMITERHERIEALLERDEQRKAVWRFLGRTGAACLVILTLLGAAKALLPAGWPW